jgi:hypothetical protein
LKNCLPTNIPNPLQKKQAKDGKSKYMDNRAFSGKYYPFYAWSRRPLSDENNHRVIKIDLAQKATP